MSTSGSGTVGRACRRRIRSRQALTTMRCSQVVTAAVAAEPLGRPERRQQRVLQRVGGLLAVAERAQRDRPQPVAVPADQLAERVGVAVGVGAQQRRVVGRRRRGIAAHGVHDYPAAATGEARAGA